MANTLESGLNTQTTVRRDRTENHLFPVFLKLEQLPTLLVGAGNVALEKLQAVLSNAPNSFVTIIAPQVHTEVKKFVGLFPKCRIIQRNFRESDLRGKRLVICATDNSELHRQIKLLANKKGILINVADNPELCDFYLGSIVQKGSLKIAISTNGKSPTVAKRLKEVIGDMIPGEMEDVLDNLQMIRKNSKGNFQEKVRRLNEITKELANQSYEG